MSSTSDALDHAPYHRLMRAYPAGRRRDELLDTMIMIAEDDHRSRPTGREIADVLRHAPRVRLGRPGSRAVVLAATVFAVLTALLVGSLAAGSAAFARFERPTAAQLTGLGAVVAPGVAFSDREPEHSLQVIVDGRSRYGFAVLAAAPDAAEWDLRPSTDGMVARLRQAGWRTDRITPAARSDSAGELVVVASKDGLVLQVLSSTGDLQIAVFPAGSRWVTVAWVLGAVVGLVLGWLLAGWASRRTEHHRWATSALAVLTTIAVLTLVPVPRYAIQEYVQALSEDPVYPKSPLWEWFFNDYLRDLTVPAVLAMILAAAVTVLARPRVGHAPTRPPTAARRPRDVVTAALLAAVVVTVAGVCLIAVGLPGLDAGPETTAVRGFLIDHGVLSLGPEPGLTASGVAVVVLTRIVTHLRRPTTTAASRAATSDTDR